MKSTPQTQESPFPDPDDFMGLGFCPKWIGPMFAWMPGVRLIIGRFPAASVGNLRSAGKRFLALLAYPAANPGADERCQIEAPRRKRRGIFDL
jgi:hypothetical protein